MWESHRHVSGNWIRKCFFSWNSFSTAVSKRNFLKHFCWSFFWLIYTDKQYSSKLRLTSYGYYQFVFVRCIEHCYAVYEEFSLKMGIFWMNHLWSLQAVQIIIYIQMIIARTDLIFLVISKSKNISFCIRFSHIHRKNTINKSH